jgi:DNA-binding MurR/RpiR family transcriptional regulator
MGLLTPQQLADQWQVSLATVYRLIRRDGLTGSPAARAGRYPHLSRGCSSLA